MSNPLCRLYLITPNFADADAFAPALEAALGGGDVSALQIRLKDVSDDDIRRACRVLAPIAQAHDVAVILNDRPDLAAELGLDGVHVGQEDAPYAAARKRVGPGAIVGVTCHDSRHLAMEAAEAGADYVAFGAFYPTETKAAPTSAPLDLLRVWQETMQTPCVAIGGITADNAAEVAAAGADFLAVSAGVFASPSGPGEAVARLNAAIAAGLRQRSV